MEEEDFEGCISCMKTKDLCDLFAVYGDNTETYAKMLESCFNIKISDDLKYVCTDCVQKLEDSIAFKEDTVKTMTALQGVKSEEAEAEARADAEAKAEAEAEAQERNEEYLDEALLEEAEGATADEPGDVMMKEDKDEDDSSNEMEDALGATNTCVFCETTLPSRVGLHNHLRMAHGVHPTAGESSPSHQCELCSCVFLTASTLREHMERCHGVVRSAAGDGKQFPCHFCENVYSGRKACYTHLRMKHGLKLSTDRTPKYTPRLRKKCHICEKDFSQKQVLNKHLWKEHGYEVEKRKAFQCPLCDERVSYGHHFDQHLIAEHRLKQRVEHLEFATMDDFMIYKSQIQEETKCRFRKTTASKNTIEGLRSHYMCSQSGVYVYQGKGIRPAPERQIYKTGKACPAHMVVTETLDCVRATFHMTHVGHGACPYYEPREPRKSKLALPAEYRETSPDKEDVKDDNDPEDESTLWMCDSCGLAFPDGEQFRAHAHTHGVRLFPCHYCDSIFQNVDAWTRHLRVEHNIGTLF